MLQARLRPHFLVRQQTAVYLIEPGEDRTARPPIKPDIYIAAPQPSLVAAGGGATAVAEREITEPKIFEIRYPTEIRQRYLEIRDRAGGSLVATIEVVSPTNKDRRGGGFEQFDRKRRAVMDSPVHWMEIDLLRLGERPKEGASGESDYYVLLKHGHGSPLAPPTKLGELALLIWPWDVRDALPVVAVPLKPPFTVVALDLAAALTTVYDRFYSGLIDYTEPPVPPLRPADATWAEALLRDWQASQSS
jgi:hypothetical protein